jgi:predicted HicB family RNase H-like nuclease
MSDNTDVMANRTKPEITSKTPIGNDVDLRHEDVRLPDGTRITDELVDDIVEEVRRRGGRPSLTGGAAVSPRVSFRVTPGVRERAAIIAEREGKTISQVAREALEARVRAS